MKLRTCPKCNCLTVKVVKQLCVRYYDKQRHKIKYDNRVPSCPTCNLSKHNKTPLEFIWQRS
jgi:hypothetical protein